MLRLETGHRCCFQANRWECQFGSRCGQVCCQSLFVHCTRSCTVCCISFTVQRTRMEMLRRVQEAHGMVGESSVDVFGIVLMICTVSTPMTVINPFTLVDGSRVSKIWLAKAAKDAVYQCERVYHCPWSHLTSDFLMTFDLLWPRVTSGHVRSL